MITIASGIDPVFQCPLWLLIFFLFSIAVVIAMPFCLKKDKPNPKLARIMVKGGVVVCFSWLIAYVIIIALYKGGITFSAPGPSPSKQFYCLKFEYLGNYLANKYPGAKALVIFDDPNKIPENKRLRWAIDALKKGFGNQITILAIDQPTIQMEGLDKLAETGSPIPWVFLWKAADVDKLIKKHPDCDLIVSLGGLPDDFHKMKLWNKNKRSKVAVFCWNWKYRDYIKDGKISAVLAYNPVGKFVAGSVPEGLEEAFKERFLLITPDNLDMITKEFPSMFEEKNATKKAVVKDKQGEQ